jgi:predicted ATPase
MVKTIHVRNFKSLKDISLQLGLRNVLVGPNMAGKSNFIDVFRFLARMVLPAMGTYGLPNAVQTMGGFSELVWKGGESNLISICLEGEFPADDLPQSNLSWHYELSIVGDQWGNVTVQDELLTVSGPNGKYSLVDKSQGRRSMLNPAGQTLSQVHDASRSVLEFEIPDWQGNLLRRYFSSWRFYHLVPPLMKAVNQTVATSFLTEYGNNLSSWLMTLQTGHSESFERIRRLMTGVFPDVESIFTVPTQQATVLVASRERHLKSPVSAWQMSDGELAFLALASLILCPTQLGSPLVCVEEPENHLHPRLLETLVEVLKQVQDELPAQNRAQVAVSTHSPYLVDKFDIEELIVAEKRGGATVFSRPSDKTHLRDLLQREEAGLGELFYSGALGSG